jgi:hypothetical protein
MLSIEELRKMLGRPELTDEQLEQIRDDLYCFARVFIDAYLRQRRGTPPPKTR